MGQQPQPPIEDESTELAITPELPKGIRADTGTGMAHDTTPVWDIVGNTIKVGNIMLVRLDPKKTSQSAFRELAIHVGEFLERTT